MKRGEEWIKSDAKRYEDIAFATALSPFAASIIGTAVLAITTYDRRSPFYTQERLGKFGMPFDIIKLRTLPTIMQRDPINTGHNHPEASRLGRFLRRTRFDELPQLHNILSGDMTTVGPRPLPRKYYDLVRDCLSPTDYAQFLETRERSKCGLLDLFQIELYRGVHGQSIEEVIQARVEREYELFESASFEQDILTISEAFKLFWDMLARPSKTSQTQFEKAT